MSKSPKDAVTALRRFGLGVRPDELSRIDSDPHGFVASQLDSRSSAIIGVALPAAHERLGEIYRAERASRITKSAVTDARAKSSGSTLLKPEAALPTPARLAREAFKAEVEARVVHAVTTDAPFIERLVLFWSNHFAVSASKGIVRGIVGGFEREAIRPNVLGRFSDLVRAAAQHPAMLMYLDNVHSVGPKSDFGRKSGRGLNENLAREILELHTLGVSGGYSQADVRALAVLLTGWTVGNAASTKWVPGKFRFEPNWHEPGGALLLGRSYMQSGRAAGEAALLDLARHPSTARNIAGKLVRHFVGDATTDGLVGKLERAFLDSDGDLATVMRALLEAREAWTAPQQKVVPPYDYMVSLVRGFAQVEPPIRLHQFAARLGHVTWSPTSPKGWPDGDQDWAGPAALRERLRIVEVFARKVAGTADPRSLADQLLGAQLTPATRTHIERAEAHIQGLVILAMSPEFLRR